ncbi:MAG: hypothetical protein JO304_21090 [Solirubrobacterales bacterium]|nr:hypothetical protein [Solirubrobacterales bacterium]
MKIEFIATVSVVTPDPPQSHRLLIETLGLPLDGPGDYLYSHEIGGSKHFGVWPLWEAAQACFGTDSWPSELTVPQVSLEFEVSGPDAVRAAAEELESAGYRLLHPVREEPWGQTIARVFSAEGSIVGISHIPSMHE